MTVITESTETNSFPASLAADLTQAGYRAEQAPELAAFFEFPAEVASEFVAAMTHLERLNAAMASYVSTPAKRAWARKVLDVYEATGSAAIAVATAPAWPTAAEPEAEAEPGTAKTCTPKPKRSRVGGGSSGRRAGVRSARRPAGAR